MTEFVETMAGQRRRAHQLRHPEQRLLSGGHRARRLRLGESRADLVRDACAIRRLTSEAKFVEFADPSPPPWPDGCMVTGSTSKRAVDRRMDGSRRPSEYRWFENEGRRGRNTRPAPRAVFVFACLFLIGCDGNHAVEARGMTPTGSESMHVVFATSGGIAYFPGTGSPRRDRGGPAPRGGRA